MNRILFVIESLFSQGSIQQLLPIARSLAEKSCEVHLVVFDNAGPDPAENDRLSMFSSVHCLSGQRLSRTMSRHSLQAVSKLRKLIGELQPDVVHSWCGLSEWITLAATQYPVNSSGRKPKRFATELYLQPEKGFSRQLFECKISSGFEKIIVPHETVKQHMINEWYDDELFRVIRHSIEVDSYDLTKPRSELKTRLRQRLNLPDTVHIAGTVAPLIAKNRLKDVIWACDLLTCIRDDFHLVIIGNGTQRERLLKFASQTESGSHVHLLGEPDDAASLMGGFDIYWQPHLNEPLPVNLIGAMAMGIPAISVFGSGTSEIIRHQETGFATNVGARDEFARWTKYLLELPDAAEKIAKQGQRFVTSNFLENDAAEQYFELYGF